MVTRRKLFAVVVAVLILGGAAAAVYLLPLSGGSAHSTSEQSTSAVPNGQLALSRTIPLFATTGRIDHMSVDVARGLLFVAAYGNNTVAVVDMKAGSVVGTLTGLSSPQGVAYVPGVDRIYVSSAGDGTVSVFDGKLLGLIGKISFSGDADNLRYDGSAKLLYVGYGDGGIAAVNVSSDKIVQDIRLPAHPESFQLQPNGQSIYANVPSSHLIAVLDRSSGKYVSNRTVDGYSGNFPMALDEARSRLFVGTRGPPSLLAYDTKSWRLVSNVSIPGDPDDIFYDSARGLVFVSCGLGFLQVFQQSDPDHYARIQSIQTAPGARTSLFVPELDSVYVAVPPSTGQQAEMLHFTLSSGASTTSISALGTSKSTANTLAFIRGDATTITPTCGDWVIRLEVAYAVGAQTPASLSQLIVLGGGVVFHPVTQTLYKNPGNLTIDTTYKYSYGDNSDCTPGVLDPYNAQTRSLDSYVVDGAGNQISATRHLDVTFNQQG